MVDAAFSKITPRRRRLGLTARAALFVSVLIGVTVALSAGAVLFGFEHESRRHQVASARAVLDQSSRVAGVWLSDGRGDAVQGLVERAANRDGTQAAAIYDVDSHLLHAAGETDSPLLSEVAMRAAESGRLETAYGPQGALFLAEPMTYGDARVGVAALKVSPDSFRYDLGVALSPFFLFLMGLVLAALPLTVWMVRRALAPLDALTRFAEQISTTDDAAPLRLRTNDEFETLANAFNHMIARLNASVQRVQQIAFVDPVTQLPNQERFLREVDFYILKSARRNELGAVLVLELRRLNELTQALDQKLARDLMRCVGERVAAAATDAVHGQGDDKATQDGRGARPVLAARLGGNEFAVLAPQLKTMEEAVRVAQSFNESLNQPLDWNGHRLSLQAACGVAAAPRDGACADAVVRRARMALRAARGKPAQLKVFTQSLDREAVARLNLERDMRAALERGEFRAYFQPKVNLANGRIEGAEALARWVREDRTIISPARFIPVAEESGLIAPLSEAIMREACWKAAAWARAGASIQVAVNVSGLQFRDERFAERVLQTLKHAGLSPKLLELEITESVAIEDPERAARALAPLRAAGVRIAVDDFGCGHSNLAALSRLSFDVIKIDQNFIRALLSGEAQAGAIVDMIFALAKTMQLEIVAEGVERKEQAAFVAERGCHWGQGFLWGAAMPAQDFFDLLSRRGMVRKSAAA